MDEIKTMKVKPWGENQGDHVIINVDDFNPEKHTPIDGVIDVVRTHTDGSVEYGPLDTETPTVKRKKKSKRKKKT